MGNLIEKDILYDMYINKQMSTRDIAEELDCGQSTVRRYLDKYNIKARTIKESKQTDTYIDKMQGTWDSYKEKYKNRIIKYCKYCGKEMELMPSEKKIYCNQECFANHLREESKEKLKNYDKTCVVCGETIIPSNGKIYDRKYCSIECRSKDFSEKFTDRVIVNCGYCGKEINVIKSKLNNEKIYCNSECMAKDYEIRFSGKNSPSWKGGKKHYQGDWQKSRNKARKRDNKTCQLCRITEKELERQMDVHHIKNYRLFEDKFEAN